MGLSHARLSEGASHFRTALKRRNARSARCGGRLRKTSIVDPLIKTEHPEEFEAAAVANVVTTLPCDQIYDYELHTLEKQKIPLAQIPLQPPSAREMT